MSEPTANPPSANGKTPQDELQRIRFRQALARKKRRERALAGEIRELNIVAMMDMMTIILVFLLKSYSSTAVAMTSSEDIRPPVSTTRATPRDTVAVTVTPNAILVGDRKVVSLKDGALPTEVMQGRVITPLAASLQKEVTKLKYIAEKHESAPFNRELSVIGDRSISYDLLLSVLYTAGQNELEHFRFVVMQKD